MEHDNTLLGDVVFQVELLRLEFLGVELITGVDELFVWLIGQLGSPLEAALARNGPMRLPSWETFDTAHRLKEPP